MMKDTKNLIESFASILEENFKNEILHYVGGKFPEKIQAIYPYANNDGAFEYANVRLCDGGSKTFRSLSLDANNNWIWKRGERPANGYPLFEQLLLGEHPSAAVFICEGEKAVCAFNQHCAEREMLNDFVALTSGGCTSADGADWSCLAGRNVTIWPDKDAAGQKYAESVACRLQGIAATVDWVDVDALGLPEKGDAADWVMQENLTKEGLRNLPRIAGGFVANSGGGHSPSLLPAPMPLSRRESAALSFPKHALGTCLGAAAEAIATNSQCDPAIAGNSVLAAAALVAQGIAHVSIDNRQVPLSLYLLTLAGSGERKSAVNSAALSPIRQLEKERLIAYKASMRAHARAMADLPEGEDPPEEPVNPAMLNEDFTLDALTASLATGFPIQGVCTAEGGTFIGGYAMAKEHLLRTSTTLSALHSGEALLIKRKQAGTLHVEGRYLSMHLMVQPEIARQFVGQPMVQEQGLLPRFLMVEAEPYIGSREYCEFNLKEAEGYVAYVQKLMVLARTELQLDGLGGVVTRALTLEPAAKELWVEAYNRIERASAAGQELEHYRAYASKLPDQILRMAGVISLSEEPAVTFITVGAMRGAIALGDFYISQAKRLLMTPDDEKLNESEALLQWLQRQSWTTFALRDVYRLGPKFVRSASTARALLQTLEQHFWIIKSDEEIVSLDGKTCKESYLLRP